MMHLKKTDKTKTEKNIRDKKINIAWFLLIGFTLFSALIAESVTPSNFIVLVICLIISIKGRIVIDDLMGLREAIPIIRYTIHSYFILLPLFIAFVVIFPETLAQLTTLK